MRLLQDVLFATAEMREVFSDRARLQAMLDVEAALARACARTALIPTASAAAIEAQCSAELYDATALAAPAAHAGNLAIPLVKAVRETLPAEVRGHFHRGATSQDILDTGLVLQLRAGLDLLEEDAARLAGSLATLADA